MRLSSFHLAALVALGSAVAIQAAAPRETATATINGKNVAVEYGRPTLHGRSFDELMKDLPADRMWRTGSEQVTTLTTDTDLLIGGKKVPAGKYSLYVYCPESGDYALAVNRDLGQPLGKIWAEAPDNLKNEPWPRSEYQKEIGDQEVVRAPMKKLAVEQPVDAFTISLQPAHQGATMTLSWGDRSWSLNLEPAS
jgi:hypothetical protein